MKQNRTEEEIRKVKKMTTIGGQALMEGLMMIGPETMAMAVRKGDGSIHVETSPVGKASKAARIPFIRGSVKIFRQMVTGTGYLMKSAEFAEETISDEERKASEAAFVLAKAGVCADPSSQPYETDRQDIADHQDRPVQSDEADRQDIADHQDRPVQSDESVRLDGPVPSAKSARAAKAALKRKEKEDIRASKGPGRLDRFFEKHTAALLYLSVVFGILLSVGLFILLPNLISSLTINRIISNGTGFGYQVLRSLFEGVIRISIFIGYLALASRMKDIRRVWMYHGAEHKTISCYESKLPLTVDNVRTFSKHHPRCGTAFMFIVLMMSIILFSFVPRINIFIDMVIRLALVPLLAGLSYELIHWAARYNNVFTNALAWPGLMLQRLTTKEPDDSMIEVAIAAMLPVIPAGERGDEW
ncbi:MAG: DUF1385 domain-containing protein [Saccharofermentanales bacterium]